MKKILIGLMIIGSAVFADGPNATAMKDLEKQTFTKYVLLEDGKLSVVLDLDSSDVDHLTIKELKKMIDMFSSRKQVANVAVEYKNLTVISKN